MDIKKIILSHPFLFIIPIILISTYIFVGFTIWLLLISLLYILFYLFFISKSISLAIIKGSYKWIILAVVIILNITLIIFVKPNTTKEKVLTKKECQEVYDEYNNKILDITGDGIKGTIGIEIEQEDCKAKVYYNILLVAQLDKNYQLELLNYPEYKYAGSVRDPKEGRTTTRGTGQLNPVFENRDNLPNDIFEFGMTTEFYNSNDIINGSSTNVFSHSWRSDFTFDKDSLSDITSRTLYEITDGSEYIIKEQIEGDEKAYSYTMDADKASQEGNIVKTFQLTYVER